MTGLASVKNLAAGLLLALLGVGTVWATADFATGAAPSADPALLPRAVAAGLVVVGLGIAVGDVIRLQRGTVAEEDAEGIPIDLPVDVPEELLHDEETAGPTDWRQVLTLAAAVVAYSVAAFQLGFVTSTLVFIVGAALLLGRSHRPLSLVGLAIFALAIALGAYVGFFVLLNVRAPMTLLP